MKQTIKAELWDKMHYLFRDYNDRMVHAEIDYDFEINETAFKTVVLCFFEKAPIFHSSFTDNKVAPYWTVEKYNINDVVLVVRTDEESLEAKKNEFLTQCLPPEGSLQMKICLFYHSGKTDLCIIENHMCMDGGDFKYFLAKLCENYSEYISSGKAPLDIKTGSRSYEEIFGGFSEDEQKIAKDLYRNINKKDEHGFPWTKSTPEDRSFIARRKISAETMAALKEKGKALGATVNDMLATAYFHGMYEIAGFGEDEGIAISCAIDLRRHLKDAEDTGMTNHTAWMQCEIPKCGKDIFETLRYVSLSANMYKADDFMGLHGLPLLSLGYRLFPSSVSEEIVKIGYANPLLAMSNIGVLNGEVLALEGHRPTDAFMSGAVKYKPFMLLSATTYAGVCTISLCERGNSEDRAIVERFFDIMEKNIALLIS